MKKLISIFVALLIISCSKVEKPIDYVVLTGKISNVNGNIFSVRNSVKIIKDIAVLNDGTFVDTIQNVIPGYYIFRYNNETSGFYLEPGYNLSISLDTKEFDETIEYAGVGSIETNYLAQKYLNDEALGKYGSYGYTGMLDEESYVHLADSINTLEIAFFENQNELSDDFSTLEKESIKYSAIKRLDNYELYRRHVTKEVDFVVSPAYPDYMKDIDLNNDDLIKVNSYISLIKGYYSKMAVDLAEQDSIAVDVAYLKTVSNEVKSSKIKERLLYGAARSGITYTESVKDYYAVFMANSIDKDHKEEISAKYNNIIRLSKGQPSPKFVNYENHKGGTTSLDDLKGKYVYVDVWATWCGPCIRQIPFLKEIENKYHDKNIVFVSMSVDAENDHDKWKQMVEEKELGGIQLFADNSSKSQFYTEYGIVGIPRFILIDPEGNIVDSGAPPPSSSNLVKLFDELEI